MSTATVGQARARAAGTGVAGPEQDGPPTAPLPWHRGVTVFSVMVIMAGAMKVWSPAVTKQSLLLLPVIGCYGALLLSAVLALTVRSRRALGRVDLLLLGTGLVLFLGHYALSHNASDEGQLTAKAAKELLAGHRIYGVPWPDVFKLPGIPLTKTMNGSGDYTYGYPPLTSLLTAAVKLAVPGMSYADAATAVTALALAGGAVLLWWLLPAEWRAMGVAVCLSPAFYLEGVARVGYTGVVALALLVPVVVSWTGTGAGGRLGRSGVLRGICLGLACSAQQLPWFVTPFLLVGLYAMRRGELRPRQALALVARYAAVVGCTFLAVCSYFLVSDPVGTLKGIALTLTQHAVPHGEGLIGISYYLRDGSGRLDFYGYATELLCLGLLALLFVAPRRLGPAAVVLPWCVFYLSTRSQDGYYQMMMPLWLAAFATCPSAAFAGAWQPSWPKACKAGKARRDWPPRMHRWSALLLLAPALFCIAVAVGSGAPLSMHVDKVTLDAADSKRVAQLTVEVRNTGATALTPHFAVSGASGGMSAYWRVLAGPTTLAAHDSASYLLVPATGGSYAEPKSGTFHLRAVSDAPMTISTTTIPVRDAAKT